MIAVIGVYVQQEELVRSSGSVRKPTGRTQMRRNIIVRRMRMGRRGGDGDGVRENTAVTAHTATTGQQSIPQI